MSLRNWPLKSFRNDLHDSLAAQLKKSESIHSDSCRNRLIWWSLEVARQLTEPFGKNEICFAAFEMRSL